MEDSNGQDFQWELLVASDIFQRNLDSIYINLPGVTGIADDMIIYGKDDLEHDRNFLRFLEVTRKNNLRLKPFQTSIQAKDCKFLWSPMDIQWNEARSC